MSEIFKTFKNLNFLHGFEDVTVKCQIISQWGSNSYFEDAYLMGTKEHVFGVFDGGSGKKVVAMEITQNYYWTGGRYASESAAHIFCQEGKELIMMAEDTNKAILEKMSQFNAAKILNDKIDFENTEELWKTTCSAIKLKKGKDGLYFDWIKIGRSYIAVIFSDRSYKILGEPVGQPNNFQGIDGVSNYRYFIEQGKESLNGVETILLFTNGFMFPQKEPGDCLCPFLIVKEYSNLEKKDLCTIVRKINSERSKYSISQTEFDDMTVIAINF